MTTTINLTFADEEVAALADAALDPTDWLHNAGIARAAAAAYERKSDPQWNAVVVSFAQAGGDISNDVAILAHGIAIGTFKNATARQAENAAADLAAQQPETASAAA